MSWLFGVKTNQVPPQIGEGGSDPNQPAPPQAPLSSSERKAMEAYRFDSSALERAAEAAKTLERSSKSKIPCRKYSVRQQFTTVTNIAVFIR